MTELDKRTLSSAKKGQLDRGHFKTLFKLRDLASELAGKPLTLEEIFSKEGWAKYRKFCNHSPNKNL